MKTAHSREAQWLLAEKYAGTETPAFFEDLERLETGEPLAYVIGWVPFLGTKISLDTHPLIPRPETEYWVARFLEELHRAEQGPVRILDLCAGSGAIGVSLLAHISDATVDFAEIDRNHHITILKNLQENRIDTGRAQIFGGDLLEKVEGTYDYILANPPYIDPELADRVEESVVAHEPAKALWGGGGGTFLIERIVSEAWPHLNQDGAMFIEHEPEQVKAIETFAERVGYAGTLTLKDQYGSPRVTVLKKP